MESFQRIMSFSYFYLEVGTLCDFPRFFSEFRSSFFLWAIADLSSQTHKEHFNWFLFSTIVRIWRRRKKFVMNLCSQIDAQRLRWKIKTRRLWITIITNEPTAETKGKVTQTWECLDIVMFLGVLKRKSPENTILELRAQNHRDIRRVVAFAVGTNPQTSTSSGSN